MRTHGTNIPYRHLQHLHPTRAAVLLVTYLRKWTLPCLATTLVGLWNLTAHAASTGGVVMWTNAGDPAASVPWEAQSDVTDVAVGLNTIMALKSDGSVVGWEVFAFIYAGQQEVPQAARSGVKAIAAGENHNVALKDDGTVIAWTYHDRYSYGAVVPPGLSGVIAIAAGEDITAALKEDGSVVTWGGYNGSYTNPPPEFQSGIVAIAVGQYHTVGLKSDGTVVQWPLHVNIPSGLTGVKAIAAGKSIGMALKEDGSVVAWGYDENFFVPPISVTNIPPAARNGVTAIAAGGWTGAAIKTDGSIISWGRQDSSTIPLAAKAGVLKIAGGPGLWAFLVSPSPPETIVTQPASQQRRIGDYVSFKLEATGFPLSYQWRKDETDIPDATNVTYRFLITQTNQAGTYTAVVSNYLGSTLSAPAVLAVSEPLPGTVVTWPSPLDPETGIDGLLPPPGLAGVIAISKATALMNNGSVVQWGSYYRLPLAAQSRVTAIASGGSHKMALRNDGTVVAWGSSSYGEAKVPAGLSNVIAVAAGLEISAALKNDGALVMWGRSYYGETNPPALVQGNVATVSLIWLLKCQVGVDLLRHFSFGCISFLP